MSTFLSYDPVSNPTTQPLLTANQVVHIGPLESGVASKLAGSAFSDQAGTLIVEQSFDGVNWDIASTAFTVGAATVNTGIDMDVLAPFVRITYTNGGTLQGVFRLYLRVFGTGRQSG